MTYPVQVPCTPTVVYTDGPDYVRGSAGVTVFPAQLAPAATWSPSTAFAKGKAEADEAFSARKNVILGPGVASGRTPLSGRTPEYLGEDSLLSGSMAAAHINGIQKGDPARPVMAALKHYVANEQELDRQTSSSNVDGRTLREVYDLPNAIAVADGKPGSVMCSFNQINGVFGCEHAILRNLLKDAGAFDRYVMSDFGAVHSTGPVLTAGLDQELNRPRFFSPANLEAAIDAGAVSVTQVDEAALRVVRAYIRTDLFDHPLPATAGVSPNAAANRAVAQTIAEQGSALLKQQGAALARLLYGDTNFTGKLPMTFPVSLADTPTATAAQYPGVFADGSTTRPAGSTAIRQLNYSESLKVGYKWYDSQNIQPRYPFGFGLSYTTFAYSNLRIEVDGSRDRTNASISFDVRNTGSVAGTKTPQVYLTLPATTGEPGKRLVGYDQVSLRPGQSRTVRITASRPRATTRSATGAPRTTPGRSIPAPTRCRPAARPATYR
ncbi:glycoside hydrolase family 3 N-terminal domain-containing protein [Dactylosporangium sp. CA-233914]|uniref:beta-glucosidase n=1 Tax=Dactylosporangium sp. CA-233914 TaxID=3239934 RepID=UPI003D8DDF93